MALVDKTVQTTNAEVLRDETQPEGNTTMRVYSLFKDLIDSSLNYLQVKQVTGASTSDVMSQKAVTDAIAVVSIAGWKTTGTTNVDEPVISGYTTFKGLASSPQSKYTILVKQGVETGSLNYEGFAIERAINTDYLRLGFISSGQAQIMNNTALKITTPALTVDGKFSIGTLVSSYQFGFKQQAEAATLGLEAFGIERPGSSTWLRIGFINTGLAKIRASASIGLEASYVELQSDQVVFKNSGSNTMGYFDSNGIYHYGGASGPIMFPSSTGTSVNLTGRGLALSGSDLSTDGLFRFTIAATASNASGATGVLRLTTNYSASSGTGTHTVLQLTPTWNSTGTSVMTAIGIDYDPNVVGSTGLDHIAARFVDGRILVGAESMAISNSRLEVRGLSGSGYVGNFASNAGQSVLRIDNGGETRYGTGSSTYIAPATRGSVGVTGTGLLYKASSSGHYFEVSGGTAIDGESFYDFNISNTVVCPDDSETSFFRIRSQFENSNDNADFALLRLNNTINATAGTAIVRGLYYDPTVSGAVGLTHIAFENKSGQIRLGGLTQDDSKTRILAVDAATGQVFWRTVSNGITNVAANTELMMSDGTNAVGSGLFYTVVATSGVLSSAASLFTISVAGDLSLAPGVSNAIILNSDKVVIGRDYDELLLPIPAVDVLVKGDDNTVTRALRLSNYNSNPLPNFGTGLEFALQTSVSNAEIIGAIDVTLADNTANSEDAFFIFRLMKAGVLNTVYSINPSNDTFTHQFSMSTSAWNIGNTAMELLSRDNSTKNYSFLGQSGNGINQDGGDLTIQAGNGYSGGGNGAGGDLILRQGIGHGAGVLGDIMMPLLPTVDPGRSGAIWNDGGFLKVS